MAGEVPDCAEAGVLGVLPGIIGTVQATEAIKLVTGLGESLTGRVLLYDALRMRFREITLPRDPECPVCGRNPSIRTLAAYDQVCESRETRYEMTVDEFKKIRAAGTPHLLIDVREVSEHETSRIDGSLLIPLGLLPQRLDLVPTDRMVVVHCAVGGRSARATQMLRAKGYDAHNLEGGIEAWDRAR